MSTSRPGGLGLPSDRERERTQNEAARRQLDLAAAQRANEASRSRLATQQRLAAEAKRDLEQHARDLAQERERARQRAEPNPWLRPGDPGYVSPEEFALRRQLHAPPSPPPAGRDAGRDRVDEVLGLTGRPGGQRPPATPTGPAEPPAAGPAARSRTGRKRPTEAELRRFLGYDGPGVVRDFTSYRIEGQ